MSFARPLCFLLLVASVTAIYTPHIDREIYDQTPSKRDFQAQNAKDAQALNTKFATLSAESSCNNEGDVACIGKDFAMCTQGKYVLMSCGPTLQCYALPLVNKVGTTVTCDTKEDAMARLGATGGSEPPSTSEDVSSTSNSEASTPTVSSATSTQVTQTTTTPATKTPSTSKHVITSAQSTKVTTHSVHSATSIRHTATSSASLPSSTLSILTGTQTGQATYYDTGLTACGGTYTDDDAIVAVSHILFDEFPGYSGANPNNNPICNLKVKATYKGRSVTATIVDRCTGCSEGDLDFTPSLYKQLDPNGSLDSGRLFGMTWEWL